MTFGICKVVFVIYPFKVAHCPTRICGQKPYSHSYNNTHIIYFSSMKTPNFLIIKNQTNNRTFQYVKLLTNWQKFPCKHRLVFTIIIIFKSVLSTHKLKSYSLKFINYFFKYVFFWSWIHYFLLWIEDLRALWNEISSQIQAVSAGFCSELETNNVRLCSSVKWKITRETYYILHLIDSKVVRWSYISGYQK